MDGRRLPTRAALVMLGVLALAGTASAQEQCWGSAVCEGAGTTSTTVTANTYSTASVANDINASCKAFSANSSGTVSAKCNKSDGNAVVTNDTSVDVSGRVGCGHSAGKHTAIHWGSDTTVHWSPKSGTWTVKLNSTGKKYLLGARCVSSDGAMTAHLSTIELDADGLDNDSGDLAF